MNPVAQAQPDGSIVVWDLDITGPTITNGQIGTGPQVIPGISSKTQIEQIILEDNAAIQELQEMLTNAQAKLANDQKIQSVVQLAITPPPAQ